ncbi:uncharacterized protein [Hetaerina americana]
MITKCFNNGMMNYYKELNCRPVYGNEPCCPIRYDCSILLGRRTDRCYYHGIEYKLKSEIPMSALHKCLANCKCYPNGNSAKFDCAIVECPEDLIPPTDETCRPKYSKDSCCSTSTICIKNQTDAWTQKLFKCELEGRTYYEGERFAPEGKCKTCYCEQGYDGSTNGPWCEDISCNMELRAGSMISNGCAPVFYSPYGMCCPMEWQCPSEKDVVMQDSYSKMDSGLGLKDNDGCFFGNQSLSLHDKVLIKESKTECTCILPPHVTCIMK